MKVWATKKAIRAQVADAPEKWLDQFCVHHPGDIRKYGTGRTSMLVLRVDAVLDAIECGETYESPEGPSTPKDTTTTQQGAPTPRKDAK